MSLLAAPNTAAWPGVAPDVISTVRSSPARSAIAGSAGPKPSVAVTVWMLVRLAGRSRPNQPPPCRASVLDPPPPSRLICGHSAAAVTLNTSFPALPFTARTCGVSRSKVLAASSCTVSALSCGFRSIVPPVVISRVLAPVPFWILTPAACAAVIRTSRLPPELTTNCEAAPTVTVSVPELAKIVRLAWALAVKLLPGVASSTLVMPVWLAPIVSAPPPWISSAIAPPLPVTVAPIVAAVR